MTENDMTKKLPVIFLILFSALTAYGQDTLICREKISLLFIGDIMGHDEQIRSAENTENGEFNYDEVFRYISPVISDADVSIANFEVTLAGPPYKGYPQFSSPAALASACKNSGIDYVVTANNHAADRGGAGIKGTINRLDSIGIPHTGTFLSSEAKDSLHPLIIKEKGFTLALLNYTYGTNGIKVAAPVIVNNLEMESVASDIEKTKHLNTDFIILFLHWGTEYDTVPSASQVAMAEYFFSRGANLIIGSHPHVLQKMIWFKDDSLFSGKAVVYSLGNFVSNQRKPKTDGGTMVRIDLEKRDSSVSISDAGYYLTWVYTPVINYRKEFLILPCAEFENRPEFFEKPADYLQMKRFINSSRVLLNGQNKNIREYSFPDNKLNLN